MWTADLLQAQTEDIDAKEPATASAEKVPAKTKSPIAPEAPESSSSMVLPPLAALTAGYGGEIYGCDKNAVPKVLPFFCRLERKMDTHFKKFDVRIRLK